MIAASIIAGRALQPLEGMIEGWRSVVQTRAAYARVSAAVEALQSEKPKLLAAATPRAASRSNACSTCRRARRSPCSTASSSS